MRTSLATLALLLCVTRVGFANEVDLSGFEDEFESEMTASTSVPTEPLMEGFEDEENLSLVAQRETFLPQGVTGKVTLQTTYAPATDSPHEQFSSQRSTLSLDYEHKFENKFRIKANGRIYYDAIYPLKGRCKFTKAEKDELESEIELYDAYVEGSLTGSLDMKIGRQVVVWGRSDTIRVTDILNPLDNRRPAITDIEDLRLPVTMAKFDYFWGDWRVTPIAVLEQRFSKLPPFGSMFNPSLVALPTNEFDSGVTYAISVGGEFSGWDINFYAAHVRDDEGYYRFAPAPKLSHEKVTMLGSAVNILSGSWLFKSELAHFNQLRYTTVPERTFARTDLLLGFTYNGIADTTFSYDIVGRHFGDYDGRLEGEYFALHKQNFQHALRLSSTFLNAKLSVNYLVSLFGERFDEGGFQRAWIKYELGQGLNTNIGVVDYRGGMPSFDAIRDNDMLFTDISYSF